ncbi:Uncharacterized protein TCM_018860 [Theobroma cacao]|uniref:Reverse transcriptase zinc-binding domain-containing protein n=1 Tax=Theobroma cacao TaxID=3641 RepID=A0A061EGH6_THECC|nr:Uncharacterized protein TCM_018860 [Theobroma cacao]
MHFHMLLQFNFTLSHYLESQAKFKSFLWQLVIERVRAKLVGWKVNMLSIIGRVTLIKAILSSLPTYFMSILHMPQGSEKRIREAVMTILMGGLMEKELFIGWIRTLFLSGLIVELLFKSFQATMAINGAYSAKSFYETMEGNNQKKKVLWKKVWARVEPPKVEIFSWQVLPGRLTMRSELVKKGLMNIKSTCYGLYMRKMETTDHLFLIYEATWKI